MIKLSFFYDRFMEIFLLGLILAVAVEVYV